MISIVVPCYNEADNLEALVGEISAQVQALKEPAEILIIDDGSRDDSMKVLKRLKQAGRVRYLSFTRNFGHQIALKAGLDHAEGDAVITMDADLQHPASLIPQMVAKWREGYPVVNTVRMETHGEGISKKLTSRFFYWVFEKLSGLPMRAGSADFRLLDKQVVRELRRFEEPHLFLRGLVHWLGYESAVIEYTAAERFAGQTKYSFRKMMRFARDGITSFSIQPLRLAGMIGTLVSCFAALYILYGIGVALFTDRAIPGWASILVSVLFLGGLQMVFIGLLGEYIGKIFIESKRRPVYVIKERGI